MMIQGVGVGELGLRMERGRSSLISIGKGNERKEKTGRRGWIANERAEKILG